MILFDMLGLHGLLMHRQHTEQACVKTLVLVISPVSAFDVRMEDLTDLPQSCLCASAPGLIPTCGGPSST
jgi:hypothetical protein